MQMQANERINVQYLTTDFTSGAMVKHVTFFISKLSYDSYTLPLIKSIQIQLTVTSALYGNSHLTFTVYTGHLT